MLAHFAAFVRLSEYSQGFERIAKGCLAGLSVPNNLRCRFARAQLQLHFVARIVDDQYVE
jgi:hypothetical protein